MQITENVFGKFVYSTKAYISTFVLQACFLEKQLTHSYEIVILSLSNNFQSSYNCPHC
jgi:hypothetical protein